MKHFMTEGKHIMSLTKSGHPIDLLIKQRSVFASSEIVPRSEIFSQVTEYQIGQFSPKLRVSMVELNVFI